MNEPPPTPGDETSSNLLTGVRNHDGDAWLRLVKWIGPFILRWCQAFPLQLSDCEEISSEVVEKLWLRIATFKKEKPGDSFRKWVRAITRNEVMDFFRRRSRDRQAMQQLAGQFPYVGEQSGDEDDPSEAHDWTSRALLLLVQDIKTKHEQDLGFRAFYRTAVDGLTAPEAALELGLSKDVVRQHKTRWIKRLRERLGQQCGELLD
jgi:RNA polymerase sigma-70 factor, ECF subfamily